MGSFYFDLSELKQSIDLCCSVDEGNKHGGGVLLLLNQLETCKHSLLSHRVQVHSSPSAPDSRSDQAVMYLIVVVLKRITTGKELIYSTK